MNDRISIRFTEEMKGYIAFGESDYERGAQEGRKSDTRLMFHLSIEVDDLDQFATDPRREATAEGWIRCDDLGGKLPVEKGVFNLFVDEDDPALKRMLYRLFFRDGSGHPVTLAGFKVVRDDPGADVWSDTTTLYTRVLQGHVEAVDESTAETIATGILHISLLDFLKQLTTFRAEGPSPAARATALGRFGALFMGQLWQVYAQRALRRARGPAGNSAPTGRMGMRPGRSVVRRGLENSRPSDTKRY